MSFFFFVFFCAGYMKCIACCLSFGSAPGITRLRRRWVPALAWYYGKGAITGNVVRLRELFLH